jgi:flagellar hook-length control protein FliK
VNEPFDPVKTPEKSATPMTFALIEQPIRVTSSPKSDSLDLKNDKNTGSDASEFGQVMSNVMGQPHEPGQNLPRQEVAADLAMQPVLPGFGTALGGDFLKAVHLGPHLNVITAETAAPDEQSLEAFARSQGLDETAVQWLMGTAPGLTMPPPAAPSESVTSLASASPLSAVGTLPQGFEVSTLEVSSDMVAADSAASLPGDPMKTGAATKSDTQIANNALNTAALWAMAQQTEKARVVASAQEDPSDAAKVQINLMAPAAPAAIWMLRNTLAVAPDKPTVTKPTEIAESELDLTQAASPELLEGLSLALAEAGASVSSDAPTPLSGHTGHRQEIATAAKQDVQTPDASASAPESGSAQRSENLQNLAEKMGQAVGQRILSEIEKGQWHLKLSLRPATLGHIEVEMRMRSGELDAVFTAPQAVTRELLQDGMAKLKDTLNQMGMDVASMQVGDGQTQKRGGESTPGQMSKSTMSSVNDSESTVPLVANAPRMKMGKDGWDVLV